MKRGGMPLDVAVRALREMLNVARVEARLHPCPKARAFARLRKWECAGLILRLQARFGNGGAETEKLEPAYQPPRRIPWRLAGGEVLFLEGEGDGKGKEG